MGALEQVMEMRNKGVPDNEIISQLSQNGTSPKEINEALSQAQIKNAVSSEEGSSTKETGDGTQMQASMMPPEEQEGSGGEGLPTEHISDEDLTPPQPGQGFQRKKGLPGTMEMDSEEEYTPQARPEPAEYTSYENSYPPEQQEYQESYDGDYAAQGMGDADTMIEIAEQVFLEKMKPLKKQVEELIEFKALSEVKIDNISERLRRIETHIDRLQAEILEKVGSYGRGIEGVKKEMSMMQESFGKMVNGIADKNEHKNYASQTSHASHTTHPMHKEHKQNKATKSKTKKSTKKKR